MGTLRKAKSVKRKGNAFLHASPFPLHAPKGFTLIELLVVITVIGILSTIFISTYTSSQRRARDGQRKYDLKQVQIALEQYYSQQPTQTYPASGTGNRFNTGMWSALSAGNYLKILPSDPINTGNNVYWYQAKSCNGANCQDYDLCAQLENPNDPEAGTANFSCTSSGGTKNYGLHAP